MCLRWQPVPRLLAMEKPTIARAIAGHDDPIVGNVRRVIQQPTFATASSNGRAGSKLVLEVTGFDAGELPDLPT